VCPPATPQKAIPGSNCQTCRLHKRKFDPKGSQRRYRCRRRVRLQVEVLLSIELAGSETLLLVLSSLANVIGTVQSRNTDKHRSLSGIRRGRGSAESVQLRTRLFLLALEQSQ